MITRVRIEASAKTENELMDELTNAVVQFRGQLGGVWAYDTDKDLVQRTKDGWWGAVVIYRKENGGRQTDN